MRATHRLRQRYRPLPGSRQSASARCRSTVFPSQGRQSKYHRRIAIILELQKVVGGINYKEAPVLFRKALEPDEGLFKESEFPLRCHCQHVLKKCFIGKRYAKMTRVHLRACVDLIRAQMAHHLMTQEL